MRFSFLHGLAVVLGVALLSDAQAQEGARPDRLIASPTGDGAVSVVGPEGLFELNVGRSFVRLRSFDGKEVAEDAYVKCDDFGLTILSDDSSSGAEVLSVNSDKGGILVTASRGDDTAVLRTSPFQGRKLATFLKKLDRPRMSRTNAFANQVLDDVRLQQLLGLYTRGSNTCTSSGPNGVVAACKEICDACSWTAGGAACLGCLACFVFAP